jgi:hypothetical protein
LTEDLHFKTNGSIYQTPIFFIRRIIYSSVLFWLFRFPLVCYLTCIYISFGNLCQIIRNMPYKEALRNKLEIYNEGCIMFITFIMGSFMIKDLDAETRKLIAIGIIVLFCTMILTNFVGLIFIGIKQLIQKYCTSPKHE